MATYNITKSDGNPGPAIADAASPDTQTDLQLVGQNAVSYGLDVATSFYWLLENFAHTSAPTAGSTRQTGQIWYDKTTSAETLNVYNGATWDQVANTNRGSSAVSSTLRWDNASNKWSEDVRVTIDGSGSLGIIGPTPGNSVAISHDDTDLNIVGTSTADINVTGVTAVNLPSLTLTTVLDETYGGTGVITYTTGDILTATGADTLTALGVGSNGDVLTVVAGEPVWQAGAAGVTALDDLSDVATAGQINNDILFRSAGTWVPSAGAATFDGTSLTATQIAGIVAGNLLDKAQNSEVITGTNWDFAGLSVSSGQLSATTGTTLRILSTDNTDWVDFSHGSGASDGNFDIDGTATVDLNITGFTGAFKSNVAGHFGFLGSTGAGVRVIGDANTDSANQGYFSVYHNDQGQEQIRMGTGAGNAFSEVRALTDDLNLYASNTLAANIGANTTTWTQNSITALVLRNAFLTGTDATTSATIADHNDNQHNVGYNETPIADDIGANINTGSFTLGAVSIGKFISRTTSTSRSVTVDADTDIPVGGSVLVHNGNSGGTLTIIPAGGQTLNWIDGSGSLPASATRTLAYNSVCTLRKVSSTVWQIWGNGIS